MWVASSIKRAQKQVKIMKQVHNLTISIYVYQDEDEKKTGETLVELLPENFEDEKIQIEVGKAKILEGRNMTLFSVSLSKQRHIKQVLEKLKEHLGEEQCATIASQENRVDSEGNLFIRLDREKLENERESVLTDKGKCFHFKIVLAAFPKSRENAIKVAKELFGQK